MTDNERDFDVVVLGAGSGGESVAGELADAGRRVAVVEEHLVGGECPYLACIPSKAMLLAAAEHRRSGSADHVGAWEEAVRRRDRAAEHQDDTGAVTDLTERGVTVVRGRGRVAERYAGGGSLAVDRGPTLRWRTLVIATGSAASAPPVDGLDTVQVWTSDDALTSPDRPASLAVLGGGAVGCELTQVYASYGVAVTLLELAPRLLATETPWAGQAMAEVLRGQGADVRTGVELARAERGRRGAVLYLADGAKVEAEGVLLGTGQRPRTDDLGLERLGVVPDGSGALRVDPRCRALRDGDPLPDVFAVGDVTGIAPYTHGANYQARIVVAHLLGHGRDADYCGVPRAVYTDPAVLAAGETAEQARDRGVDVATAALDATQTSRAFLEQADGPARVELVVDGAGGRILGGCVVGPRAEEWGGELVLAVRARLDVATFADSVRAFPTWSEAWFPPAHDLVERGVGGRA